MTGSSNLETGGALERIGITAAGHPLLVVDGAVNEIVGEELVEHDLYRASGENTILGAVAAIAPRAGGGAWIAAEGGLFLLDTLYVSHVPIDVGGRATAVSEASLGALAGLWIGGAGGLFHRAQDGSFERLEIDSAQIATTQLAVEAQGLAALALDDRGLMVLEPQDGKIFGARPSLEAGAVHGVAAGKGVLWAAADGGLLRWRAGDTPPWTRFTLASEPAAAVPTLAVAADPATGDAWARSSDRLIHAAPDGSLTAFDVEPLAMGSTPLLAVDGLGDAWSSIGGPLSRISTGASGQGVSYDTDVKPWIAAHCAQCHANASANFEVYEVFAEKAEQALSRVRAGDMPRCDGGVPCPENKRLLPADYAVLESWIRQGKPR